jgi:hypothetical protein
MVIWEEAAAPNPDGLKPELVALPDGFYKRERQGIPGLPHIVCGQCDFVLPD